LLHQQQHPPLVERGDDSGPHHACVHQMLDRLEKGFNLLLLGGNETIA
jgi:hypothetical protein